MYTLVSYQVANLGEALLTDITDVWLSFHVNSSVMLHERRMLDEPLAAIWADVRFLTSMRSLMLL